ncbi:MAG: hypothetical protein GTN84_05405, partial [Hydrogenophaga sp.]|uniref:hypothetical protein n=1 Tax=Hydrogenophaga sp. TaxID=1904254 RepID=UPI001699EE70
PVTFTSDTKQVYSQNGKDGNVNFKCYAEVDNPTGRAVKCDFESTGLSCGVLGFGGTESWKQVIDSEGNAVLTCKFHWLKDGTPP